MDLKVLLELQLADTHLNQIEHKRAALAERKALADLDAAVKAANQRRELIAKGIADLESGFAAAEAKGVECDTKRKRLEAQLKTVIAPREAEALQHEIAMLRDERDQADGTALDLMEQIAEQQQQLDETAALIAQLVNDRPALKGALDAVESELTTEAESCRVKREGRAVQAGGDINAYESKRKALGGIAVAALEGHVCSGCHLDISVGELGQLRAATDDPECPNCGRWLVL